MLICDLNRSIFRLEGDLKRIYHSNLTDTMGFEMLMIFFNLTGIIMAGYVTLGIALQLNMTSSIAELEAMSHSPKNWNIRFYQEMTLDSQSQIVQGFYQVSSFACFILFLLLLLLYRAGLKLAATQQLNRVTTFFLTLNNFVTPVLTFNLLYYTYGASAYVTELPIIGERFLPPSVIRTLVAFSVLTLMLNFVGISGINQEKKVVMEYFMGGLTVCTIVIIAMSGLIT